MKIKLIVFDVDGTLTGHPSSWQFLHEHLNVWDGNADRHQKRFLAGKISYAQFCRLDAEHWKGMRASRIRKIVGRIPYTKNAKRYIFLLKKKGIKLASISTGLHFMSERIKRDLGFDRVLSNRLLARRGVLTGGVRVDVGFGGKGLAFRKLLRRFGAQPHEVVCVGDGEGDIPMMKLAGLSIAFNPRNNKVIQAADYVCRTRDFKEVYNIIFRESAL